MWISQGTFTFIEAWRELVMVWQEIGNAKGRLGMLMFGNGIVSLLKVLISYIAVVNRLLYFEMLKLKYIGSFALLILYEYFIKLLLLISTSKYVSSFLCFVLNNCTIHFKIILFIR